MIAQDAPLQTESDVVRTARNLLHESGALRVFPTPVERIVQTAELAVDSGVDLSTADPGFFSRHVPTFQRAFRKVIGIFDYRRKKIYLDLSQQDSRRRFITLHETGHGALPWQRDLCLDDDETLSSDVKEEFEREANAFASEVLFQQEVFEEEAFKLELTIKAPMALSRKFGGSIQAAARRYVEHSPKRCSALVLDMKKADVNGIAVRNFFASPSFCEEFGELVWPDVCPPEHAFVRGAMLAERRRSGVVMAKSAEFLDVSSTHAKDPRKVQGHAARIDLDGFSAQVKAAFKAGTDRAIEDLVERFNVILTYPRQFVEQMDRPAIMLPWAGDQTNLIFLPKPEETYDLTRGYLPTDAARR